MAMRLLMQFGECEHSGDLQRYADAVRRLGAKVLESRMARGEYETGEMVVEVADRKVFEERLRKSEIHGLGGVLMEIK